MTHNIKIHGTMIPMSIIFSTIAFYYECCKSGRKKGVLWEATLNQGESPSFPTLVMYENKISNTIL